MSNPRDRFLAEYKQFMSMHLDAHHSAETTLELEVAALLTMVDVGSTTADQALWHNLLRVLRDYANQSLAGETTARMRALYRLADQHAERTT